MPKTVVSRIIHRSIFVLTHIFPLLHNSAPVKCMELILTLCIPTETPRTSKYPDFPVSEVYKMFHNIFVPLMWCWICAGPSRTSYILPTRSQFALNSASRLSLRLPSDSLTNHSHQLFHLKFSQPFNSSRWPNSCYTIDGITLFRLLHTCHLKTFCHHLLLVCPIQHQ